MLAPAPDAEHTGVLSHLRRLGRLLLVEEACMEADVKRWASVRLVSFLLFLLFLYSSLLRFITVVVFSVYKIQLA